MYPSRFRYEAPHSLDEAISLLHEGGDDAKVLAGGQSLVPLMKLRFASPELIVDINNIGGLAYHRADADGTLRIGALCRHVDLERSDLLKSSQPTMAAAASVAPMVDPPTPVSAMPALVTFAPMVSIATATPTVAKSPTRRSSLR